MKSTVPETRPLAIVRPPDPPAPPAPPQEPPPGQTTVASLHDAAMRAADEMHAARRAGKPRIVRTLAAAALGYELEALNLAIEHQASARTRHVLRRSGAWLALHADDLVTAENLVAAGLLETSDEDAREAWFALLEQVRATRHFKTEGFRLNDTEVQLAMAGNAIVQGTAPSSLVATRVQAIRSLMVRHGRMALGLGFHDASPAAKLVDRAFQPRQSLPRAASFQVTVRFAGIDGEQYPMKGIVPDADETARALDPASVLQRVMRSAQCYADGGALLLRELMDEHYARAIGTLFEHLAPDEQSVNVVGLTSVIDKRRTEVNLPPRRSARAGDNPVLRQLAKDALPAHELSLTGTLKFGDGRKPKAGVIRISTTDEDTKGQIVHYDPEAFADIVPEHWGKRVQLELVRVGTRLNLRHITLAP